ncbi:MAG: PAS domain S-box protein [Nitrospirota bacterium]
MIESEERYRSVFEGANDGIIAYDLKAEKFSFVNKRMSILTGYTEEEILQLHVRDLHPPKDLPFVLEQFNEAASGMIKELRTIPVLRKDGSVIYCDISSSFMNMAETPLLIGFFKDVTDREVAESARRESERRFRDTFENAAVGIALGDEDARWIQVNRKFSDILGYSIDELTGMTFRDITHPDDLKAGESWRHQLLRGDVDHFAEVKRYIHKDGHIVWCMLTLSIQRDDYGNFENFIAIIEDISQKKKTEEALQETLKEVERSNKELQQFAYIVSHDLKEPLRMIISYAQIIGKRYKDKLDKNADEFIEYMIEGTTRMDALLDDLLAYSRVGKNAASFQDVDLTLALKKAISNLKRIIGKSSVEITSEDLPTVTADEVQMIQLFQNLITNAIKFHGNEAPRINISADRANNEWTVRLSDNGIGIDHEHLERIFLMFKRLHPRGKYPGTGVGLSICKKIVERHGGSIWAESSGPGTGTRFCFTIKDQAMG